MKVKLSDVSKHFGGVPAVDGVSVEVASGEFFFLLGPSGCGKTTLLRLLAGFEVPDRGSIHFGQREVTHVAPERRGTAMVFQSYALWPHMSVADNVAFGLESLGVSGQQRRHRVAQALELVHLSEYGQRKPNELSGGQQQRVALARALVIEPALVLLDEPLSNLDARLRQQMRIDIRRIIKQSGHTAIYVTHDRQEAMSMADRCAIMQDGLIVQTASPRELYRQPVNRFVAEFLGDANCIAGQVRQVDNGYATVETPCGLWRGRTTGQLTAGSRVLCQVRPEALRIGTPPADGNRADARLETAVFLGEMTQYLLESDAGQLSVLELSGAPRSTGPVAVWAAPEDTVVMADSQEG